VILPSSRLLGDYELDCSPKQQRLVLRRLSLLTSQACAGRKEELLDLAMELLLSPDRVIGSGAVHMVICTVVILENTPSLVSRPENKPGATPTLRERIKAAVARAVQLGPNKRQDKFAREFLAH
jgi:hypothetical protein